MTPFGAEVVGTMLLILFGDGVVANLLPNSGFETGLAPLLVGVIVWAIGLLLGGSTGYAINPARDLGPRIAHFLLPVARKGDSDWGYAWVPVIGPLAGAWLYQTLWAV